MENKKVTMVKDVAAWALRELYVSTPYVLDFEANDSVYLFDCTHNYNNIQRIAPSSELADKIREIEKERRLKVYAVTHDYLPFIGETYSFLCISPYQVDWDGMVKNVGKNIFLVYAYVYNVEMPECSESGYVALRAEHGKLVRVG